MRYFFSCWILLMVTGLYGQQSYYQDFVFTKADSLRGRLSPVRSAYDVRFYDLQVVIQPEKKAIQGRVKIHFDLLSDTDSIQVDLYENMHIYRIAMKGSTLPFHRAYDAVFISLEDRLKVGERAVLEIEYGGNPQIAEMPPWEGGFVWSTDDRSNPWVGVACEGDGASLWWPNKDHLSDEPDSMRIAIEVPKHLMAVSNGNLITTQTSTERNTKTYHWKVSYPINNYNVTVNVADYVHFSDTFVADDGTNLPLDYYVLRKNAKTALKHFRQVGPMLDCFETYFGKYPFWEDGYALVETPYLGMEHQGAIAYGNHYQSGYLGTMIPSDMNWDYIIVHETGHEWWGNSVSCNDLAEMWIHESFTTYMEALFIECMYNYDRAVEYLMSQRSYIANSQPILGPLEVNWHHWKSSDHYYKGAWMLHTLRSAMDDDSLFFETLRTFYERHAYSHATTEDFVQWVNQRTDSDWTPFFDQYLRHPSIPILLYKTKQVNDGLLVRTQWLCDEPSFAMPVKVGKGNQQTVIFPTTTIRDTKLVGWKEEDFVLHPELYLIRLKEK